MDGADKAGMDTQYVVVDLCAWKSIKGQNYHVISMRMA
jgi:hypothetical protein